MEIELPPDIQELVQSYDDNCNIVERRALDTISSFEIPVFNGLRDITARNCYMVLCSIPKWFGNSPTIEHCTCLVALTEYISCSYNNTDFYDTFVKSKQDKFYESFFVKLANEWKKLFHRIPCSEFSSYTQFNYLKTSLQKSFKRFPNSFMYNWLLREILAACENFGTKFKLQSSYTSESLRTTRMNEVSVGNSVQQSQITNFITSNSCKKASDKPVPLNSLIKNCNQVIQKVACKNIAESSQICQPNFVTSKQPDIVGKPNSVEAKQNPICEPDVITIEDAPSPAKKPCKAVSETSEIFHHTVPERAAIKAIDKFLKPTENSLSNIQSKICQREISDKPVAQVAQLPKKLNAFDILMRRTIMKKKNIS